MKKLVSIYKGFVLALPVVLFFSFYPVMSFGQSGTMNYELSLPLIWLALFDVLGLILVIWKKKLLDIFKKWYFMLLPIYLLLSVIWTTDKIRWFLIIAVLIAIYFAVYFMYALREYTSGDKFRKDLIRSLLVGALFVCGWCLVQSILDVAGVSQGCSLICAGCTYKIFGFPHPNGFAVEPQIMGNLLLAPIFVTLYLLLNNEMFKRKNLAIVLFILVATLFLTLSRGAIYAFGVGLVVMTIYWIVRTKKAKVLLVWLLVIVSFLFTLNIQGIFSELSKTNDTYISGISKAVNQLTLGIIDLGGSQVKKNEEPAPAEPAPVEPEQKEEQKSETESETSVFDGYVEVSTDVRVNSWKGALKVWRSSPKLFLFGVGFGSAPISLFNYGIMDSSWQIINNEYVNLLLETGFVGICLVIYSLYLVFKFVKKNPDNILFYVLLLSYMVSLLFFSGLPNALHIYLLPAALLMTYKKAPN